MITTSLNAAARITITTTAGDLPLNAKTIKVNSLPTHREGSNCERIQALIAPGMTVGQYKLARYALRGLPGNGMAYLNGLVRAGYVELVN